MFIEACIIAAALQSGSDLLKKLKARLEGKNRGENPLSRAPKKQPRAAVQKVLPADTKISEYEKTVNQSLALSGVSGVLALSGSLVYSPLGLVSGAVLLYASLPIFKGGFHAVFRERNIKRIAIIDTVAVLAAVGYGYYLCAASIGLAYFGAAKFRIVTEKKSRQSLSCIFGEQPSSVWILKDGVEMEIPFASMQPGDTIVVSAGEPVPADGVVVRGMASVDQHMLTGESQPAEKQVGDRVFAATVMTSGRLYIQVEKAGTETSAAKITEILQKTADFTDSIESVGQEIADTSVPPAMSLALLAAPFVGLEGFIALLYSDFLVNMRLTAPIGMLNFLNKASQSGILIKDGRSLQLLTEIDTIVFDKTGTLTLDQPHIRSIHTFSGMSENRVLTLAAAAEHRQTHPVAGAILEEARERELSLPKIDDAGYKIGYGITVTIGTQEIRVGSDRFMETEGIDLPDSMEEIREDSHERGCSLVYVAENRMLIGAIELEPTIRPEVREVIQRLKKHGLSFCIISGDHEKPTANMARKLGIDKYFAQVLPQDKAALVEQLQKKGRKVCFVGDGINDAIALKKANVSVSICGASTVATDSAQIVLMDKTLRKLPDVFEISYNFQNNMRNIFLAVTAPMAIGIGGVFFMNFQLPVLSALYTLSAASGTAVALLPDLRKKEKVSLEHSSKSSNL